MSKEGRELAWRNFERLGDLIGQGEHLQEGGEWIIKEYKSLQKLLLPKETKEIERLKRKARRKQIDRIVRTGLDRGDLCTCKGELEQRRRGSFIVYCKECNKRYKYKV